MYKKNEKVFICEKNEEAVLLNMKTGKFLGIQDTSYKIWELLDDFTTIEEIVHTMSDIYNNVEKEILVRDVKMVLDKFIKEGLVV